MSAERTVVSIRCSDWRSVVPGSKRAPCATCSAEVWLSPSSGTPARLLCVRCALAEAGGQLVANPLTEAQAAEIASHYAKGTA